MTTKHPNQGLRAALDARLADRWVFLALLLLIVWLPLPRGTNRLWAVSFFEMTTFGLAAVWLLLYIAGKIRAPSALRRARPVFVLWLLWLLWVGLQLLPLPTAVVSLISPITAEAYRTSAEFLGTPGKLIPISLYPHATRTHLLESAAYLCLFSLVLATVVTGARLRVIALTLVFSGLFQSMYGTLFLLSGAEHGLFFDTANRLNVATGTFVNRNHLAGYLQITSAVGIGLVLAGLGRQKLPDWRARLRYFIDVLLSPTIRFRVFLGIMVIALILTRSRGGNIAFFASLGIAGLIYISLRERRLLLKSLLIFGTLFLVDLWLVGSWFGVEEVVERLETTQLSQETRAIVWPGLVLMLKDFWLTGTGLGTFGTAFPAYRPEAVAQFNDQAHNDYMQFLIETGVPGTLLIGLIVLLVLIHALRVLLNRRDRLACGMAFASLMAMTAIAIHSLTDFNLQIPANAATLIVVMAVTVSCSSRSLKRKSVAAD